MDLTDKGIPAARNPRQPEHEGQIDAASGQPGIGCIGQQRPNVFDTGGVCLGLHPLDGLGGDIHRIDPAFRPRDFSRRKAEIAGTAPHLQHLLAALDTGGRQPFERIL